MTNKLEGKTAVITGGTEGIGLATAKLFVKEGAYVFITGRRQKELDEAVNAIGPNATGVQGDVAKLADLDRLYETVGKVKGRVDIIFANAGVGEFVPFGEVSEEHFDKLININVKGAFFTVQKGLPLLNDGGSIILTGSVASVKGTAAFGVYAASKAGIRSFVRTWTTDLKDRHIRSNVISPGPISTPLTNRQPADVIARIASTVPMGRMGEPDEVAKAALYLASDDSSFVTGIELFVDGGRAQSSDSPVREISMSTQQQLASVNHVDRDLCARETEPTASTLPCARKMWTAWRVIGALLESGAVKPIVARTFPLEEAAEALRYQIESRPFGRVVLEI